MNTSSNPSLDRFFKQRLREQLMASVYDPWDTRLQERIDDMIVSNSVRNGSDEACLRLRGLCFWHSSIGDPKLLDRGYFPKNKLHPSLKQQAHTFWDDYSQLEEEKRIVSHSLSSVLSISDSAMDYQEMLPEGLHDVLYSNLGYMPDQSQAKRAAPAVVAAMKAAQAPHLALMGQRFVMSIIL